MKIIDLSHTIKEGMPVFPGSENPALKTISTVEVNHYFEKRITIDSHTGTHIDAPAHIIHEGNTLEQLSMDHFFGRGMVLNLLKIKKQTIEVKDLKFEEEKIKNNDFLLINTGWSRFWGSENYFTDFPVFSTEAARWLAGLSLKGIGIDAISADETKSVEMPVHRIFLEAEMVIIENLTNLGALSGLKFYFSCLPLKMNDADGSPVRAVGLVDDLLPETN